MRLDYKWRAAIVVAIGLFMAVLDITIVSVALPQMQAYFHTNRDTITWVATAYLLAQAAVIPITGFISDRVGTKLVFLVALALFTVGSALCAFSPTEGWLIAFRVFQGIGGGALFPVAFAIIFRVFPPTERGAASALIGVPVLLAPAFGPTIGGFFTQTFDWRAIFLINVPVGVVAFIGSLLVLHGGARERVESDLGAAPARQRFDIAGLVLSMVGFTALVYGISEAALSSWSDRTVVISLVTGSVLLVAFVINELVVADPVMDVRLFGNYTFAAANVLTWVVSGFLFASIYLLPIFYQNVQGHSPLQSGEFVIVQGLGAAIATVIAGRLYNQVGPRGLVSFGFILVTVGTYGLTKLSVNTTWQSMQIWLLVRGLGSGLYQYPFADAGGIGSEQPGDGARLLADQCDQAGLRRCWHHRAYDHLCAGDQELRHHARSSGESGNSGVRDPAGKGGNATGSDAVYQRLPGRSHDPSRQADRDLLSTLRHCGAAAYSPDPGLRATDNAAVRRALCDDLRGAARAAISGAVRREVRGRACGADSAGPRNQRRPHGLDHWLCGGDHPGPLPGQGSGG